jgi:hypothetical protein
MREPSFFFLSDYQRVQRALFLDVWSVIVQLPEDGRDKGAEWQGGKAGAEEHRRKSLIK